MSDRYDYGPLQTYEITWMSGHVERVPAHQVSHSGGGDHLGALVGLKTDLGDRRINLHGEIAGRWLLVLSALEKEIRTIRLVTGGEAFAGESFDFIEGGEGL